MDYKRRGRNSHGGGEEKRGASRYRDSPREMRETITMNYSSRSMNGWKTLEEREGRGSEVLVAF